MKADPADDRLQPTGGRLFVCANAHAFERCGKSMETPWAGACDFSTFHSVLRLRLRLARRRREIDNDFELFTIQTLGVPKQPGAPFICGHRRELTLGSVFSKVVGTFIPLPPCSPGQAGPGGTNPAGPLNHRTHMWVAPAFQICTHQEQPANGCLAPLTKCEGYLERGANGGNPNLNPL